MALTEVKRFIKYLAENRKALTEYNEKLLASGSFRYNEPMLVSAGYYASPMIPENIEDDLLQRIIDLDGRSARKLEKLSAEKGEIISLKDRLVSKFDELVHGTENKKEYVLNNEEIKRHRLFEHLAKLAQEDGFNISTDDLLYFIGKAVLVIIVEHPDFDETQIFNAVLDSFD
ncbi:hypothetical protein GH810_16165 [Acetobacterium paludosum]|uniref:Uncharacterized protein n=1 Tax=Acetobacterium paludosum TaxID=52693 RepID=A0A923HZ76_9FIRM|nr:hypothetical protein [Acetobacterium paludosum]MBC3889840.1 hypothetical protein [Acetobacterium paludosum]